MQKLELKENYNVWTELSKDKEQEYQANFVKRLEYLHKHDNLQLLNTNKLYNLYANKKIDYPMYRGLNLIYSNHINLDDLQRRTKYTYKQRYNRLKNNFKLFYDRSGYKLNFNCLKLILNLIKAKSIIEVTGNELH